MTKLRQSDVQKLDKFTRDIQSWLSENMELAEGFGLRGKFAGPLGEAMAMKEMFAKLKGRELQYEWFGGTKAKYDLVIKNSSGRSLKIQVKSSFQGRGFRPFAYKVDRKCGVAIAEAYEMSQNGFRLPDRVNEMFDEQVDDEFRENGKTKFLWVFVSTGEKGNQYFVLDKNELKSLMKKDYERYIRETKHGKRFNYAITKQRKILIIIKVGVLTEDLRNYKDRWDKVTSFLC